MRHEYNVLHGETTEELTKEVNMALSQGWELWGNPFCGRAPGFYSIGEVNKYCQAVVRLRETEVSDVEKVAYKPVGYTVQVPVLEELSPTVIPVSELKTVVEAKRVVSFSLPLCTCLERIGGDPTCEFHKLYPVTNLRS